MSPAPAPPPHQDADPRRWKALAVCLVVGFMTLLDVSIVNVALPSISASLGAGDSALQWVVSGYALTFGLLLVPAGRFGDARGRRRAFLLGLVLFVSASVACGLAPTSGFLVGARLLQGAAGGLITPQVSGLVQQLFSGAERARAFGFLGASIGLSTAVGPVLGGLLIGAAGADLGWRLVFFVNVPVGLLAVVLALRLLPEDSATGKGYDTDPVGVLLLGSGTGLLLYGLISSGPLLLYPVGAALLAAWVVHEKRYAGEPVVDLSLFARPGYSAGALIAVLFFAGFTGVFFILALHLQDELGRSALVSGLAVLPFAVGSAVAAAVGGPLVTRYGRPVVVAGLVLAALGFAGTWLAAGLAGDDRLVLVVALPLLVAGIGSGLVITPNITLTLSGVPVPRAGTAGGVLQTGQRIGAAAGIAVTGSVFVAAGLQAGLLVITGFVLLSLAVAVVDTVRSAQAEAPVDDDDLAGDVRRADEPQDDLGHVGR